MTNEELHSRADAAHKLGNDLWEQGTRLVNRAAMVAAETGDRTGFDAAVVESTKLQERARTHWARARELRNRADSGPVRKRQTRRGPGRIAVASVLAGGNGRLPSGQPEPEVD